MFQSNIMESKKRKVGDEDNKVTSSEEQNKICFFSPTAKYGELSNFYPLRRKIIYQGKEYATSEHLYQASKFLYTGANAASLELAEMIRTARTPYMAKVLTQPNGNSRFKWQEELKKKSKELFAKGAAMNPLWDEERCVIMRAILVLKFTTDSHCKTILLSTKRAKLFENSSTDAFWGVGAKGNGKNMLGILLERVREEIRSDQ